MRSLQVCAIVKIMKFVVFILLAAIVISLATSLFYLSRDDADSTKMLTALKVRVVLSGLLIAFLVSAYLLGWIENTA